MTIYVFKSKFLILLISVLLIIVLCPRQSESVMIGANSYPFSIGSRVNDGGCILEYSVPSGYKISGIYLNLELHDGSDSAYFAELLFYADGTLMHTEELGTLHEDSKYFFAKYIPIDNASNIRVVFTHHSGNNSYGIYGSSDQNYVNYGADVADNATVNAARIAAEQAKTSANTASSRALTTVNQTVDAGTSSASWAHQSYDKANLANDNTAYIRMLCWFFHQTPSTWLTNYPTITSLSTNNISTHFL